MYPRWTLFFKLMISANRKIRTCIYMYVCMSYTCMYSTCTLTVNYTCIYTCTWMFKYACLKCFFLKLFFLFLSLCSTVTVILQSLAKFANGYIKNWLYKWVPNSHFGYKFDYLWLLFLYTEALFNDTDIDYHILALLVKVASTFVEVEESLSDLHVHVMYMYIQMYVID